MKKANNSSDIHLEFRCERGFSYDISRDACINIRECEFDLCGSGARCIDVEGSFKCVCPPGYTLNADGITCSGVY